MTRFSLLVIGDTQYLFDGDRTAPGLLTATLERVDKLISAGAIAPLRHVIHVGDVTEHGWRSECEQALRTLTGSHETLDGLAWTIATGNHDVDQSHGDDRGPTPFLDAFGPGSPLVSGGHLVTPVAHSRDGYSSWRVLDLPGGGRLGVLALDWRPTAPTWAWADGILATHRDVPTVLVSHDAAVDARLTPHGAAIQERLRAHPHVFLVIGGHEWPSARVPVDGREFHAVNHQQLPFGGAGTVRVYEFDPEKGEAQAITLNAALTDPLLLHSVEARRHLSLARPEDQFRFPLPAALGGGRTVPWQADGFDLVIDEHPDGEREFDAELPGTAVIEVECVLPSAMPERWEVLLARLGSAPGSSEPLAALSLSSENFVGWQAAVESAECWATSHEYQPGAELTVVVRQGEGAGMWIDGDQVGRVDAVLAAPLLPGPWRWRVGAGEYAGQRADDFRGTVRRVRMWRAPSPLEG